MTLVGLLPYMTASIFWGRGRMPFLSIQCPRNSSPDWKKMQWTIFVGNQHHWGSPITLTYFVENLFILQSLKLVLNFSLRAYGTGLPFRNRGCAPSRTWGFIQFEVSIPLLKQGFILSKDILQRRHMKHLEDGKPIQIQFLKAVPFKQHRLFSLSDHQR